LEVGKAVEEEDPFGQSVRVLHLVDGFGALELGELVDAPIVEKPIVQPVLVGRRQLVLQRLIEKLDDFGVALHSRLLSARRLYARNAVEESGKSAENCGKCATESQSQSR